MNQAVEQEFDTIVVGSGPGGASVSRELVRRGQRVLILERGPHRPISGTLRQAVQELIRPGRSLLLTPELLAMVRGITAGGSSVFAYATAFEPPHEMLRRHGVDIRDEVEELKAQLPYGCLSDELIGPAAHRIMDAARDLGYEWNPLPKLVFQDRCRPGCDRCSLGCPHGAKWTARCYLEEAVAGGAVLLDRARVTKVIVSNGAATGVEMVVGGRRRQAEGARVVVAAGGVGTPVILRASGIKRAGQDFFCDPLTAVMGTVDDLQDGREFPMAAGVHFAEEGYLLTDMVLPRPLYQVFTAEVGRFHRMASHARTLPIMIKIKDTLSGRVTDSEGVRKRLTKDDRAKLARGRRAAERILKRAGARGIFSWHHIASHPGGTAKIGDVVDADLATEISDLYVCDCSVIPEECGLPPTLTVLALGKRLAKHLAGAASLS